MGTARQSRTVKVRAALQQLHRETKTRTERLRRTQRHFDKIIEQLQERVRVNAENCQHWRLRFNAAEDAAARHQERVLELERDLRLETQRFEHEQARRKEQRVHLMNQGDSIRELRRRLRLVKAIGLGLCGFIVAQNLGILARSYGLL